MGVIYETVLAVGLLIVVAKLAEGIGQRIGLISIVAYTATGVLLGPVAGVVELSAELHVLLGVGVFLLFFLIGFDEIDPSVVVATLGGKILIFALISFLVPLSIAYLVVSGNAFDLGLGLSDSAAFAVATILSSSSLGIVAKVLAEAGRLRDPLGIRVFGTVLVIKLLVLPLVGFTLEEESDNPGLVHAVFLFAKVVCFVVVTYVAANRVLPPLLAILRRVLRVPQLTFGIALGGLLLIVAATGSLGLHGSIGALLFGAALSGVPFQVRRDIVPSMRSFADGLFVPLFFASGGLQLTFSFSALRWSTVAAVVLIPMAAKFVGPYLGAIVTRTENPGALATSLMAKGITEVALLLVLVESGMIGRELFSLLMLVMFAYAIVSPILIRYVVRRTKVSKHTGSFSRMPSLMVRFALTDITVDDILDRHTEFPGPDISVREFSEQWVVPHQHEYVVARERELSGIVSVSMLRYLPKEDWSSTSLGDVVRHSSVKAWPDEHVEDVLQRMQDLSLTALPVLDRESGALVGSVTSQEIHELIVVRRGT